MILLKCENMFAMLILHALILHSGDNIEILPNPRLNYGKFILIHQIHHHHQSLLIYIGYIASLYSLN